MAGARDGTPVRRRRDLLRADVEAAKRVQRLLDAGLPEEGVLEIARLLGMTMSQLAAANRRLIADAFMREGDTEYDVAHRFAAVAEEFLPLIGETLSYTLALHLREQIRHDAFDVAELSSGRPTAADEATVCFADMVGFTQLGETLDPSSSVPSPAGSASSPRRWSSPRCGW